MGVHDIGDRGLLGPRLMMRPAFFERSLESLRGCLDRPMLIADSGPHLIRFRRRPEWDESTRDPLPPTFGHIQHFEVVAPTIKQNPRSTHLHRFEKVVASLASRPVPGMIAAPGSPTTQLVKN
jgi:hypothetical protein